MIEPQKLRLGALRQGGSTNWRTKKVLGTSYERNEIYIGRSLLAAIFCSSTTADIPQEVEVYVGPNSNTGDPLASGNTLIWDSREDEECVGEQKECQRVEAELINARTLHAVNGLGENLGIGGVDEGDAYKLMRVLVVNRSSPEDDAVYSGRTRSITLIDDWNAPPGHTGRVEHEAAHDFVFNHLFDVIWGDETQGISEGIAIILQATTEPPVVIREPETDNWKDAIATDPHEAGVQIYHAYKRLATAIRRKQGRPSLTQYATSKMSTTTWTRMLESFWGPYSDRSIWITS